MASSPIGSPMLKARVPLLLDLPEQAWFDVALMHKDIRLALEAADELAIPLPSAAVADEMLSEAERARLRAPRCRRAPRGPRPVTAHSSG